MENDILILFAHPAFERSRVQARLLESARNVPGVTIHDLYETYPDFRIDVRAEQERVMAHHTGILQHPFYWYSTPAILKEWLDLVLEYGWAYGEKGTALRGHRVMQTISTGGPADSYDPAGYNRFTIPQLLAPMEQSWLLCGVHWLQPFVVHGALALDEIGLDAEAARYAARLKELLENQT